MYPINQPIKAGLVLGIILVLMSTLIYAFDINIFSFGLSILYGLLVLGIVVTAAFIVIKKMRDNELNGSISFMQAFVGGFVFLIIALYLNNLFSFILNGYIDPEYLPAKMEQMISGFEDMMPEEAVDEMAARMEENLDTMKTFVKNLWINPIMAAVISSIIALIVKRKKMDEQTMEA